MEIHRQSSHIVIGAGAIGTWIAFQLTKYGIPTRLLVRALPNTAQSKSIAVIEVRGSESQRLPIAVTDWNQLTNFDSNETIWVACKIRQLAQTLQQLAPRLKPGIRIVLVQNGIGVAKEAEQIIHSANSKSDIHWIRALGWLGVRLEKKVSGKPDAFPEIVLHVAGVDGFEIANLDPLLEQDLKHSRIKFRSFETTDEVEWRKGLWNISSNALLALANRQNGAAADDPSLRLVSDRLFDEALQVAKACAIPIDPEVRELGLQGLRTTAANWNSMWVDLQAGRQTEMPWLNGAIVRLAKLHGIDCPVNSAIASIIESLENHPLSALNK